MEIPMRRLLIAAGLCLSVLSPALACNNYDETLKRAQYARDTSTPEQQARIVILDGDILNRLLATINTLHGSSFVADRAIVLQWNEGAFLSLATGTCVTSIHHIPLDAWNQLMALVLGRPA